MRRNNHRGMASIIIVAILVILLTLTSLGFAKLMDRSVNNSLTKQLNSSANYAAQTGLNDVLGLIQKKLIKKEDTTATKCDDLIKKGGDLEGVNIIDLSSGTRYDCALVNPTPNNLAYQQVPPNRAQIVKLTTCSASPCSYVPADKLMFSWQSSDRTKNQFPASTTNLINEFDWNSSNYASILRLTLYPIPLGGSLTDTQANSKTFFLLPGASSNPQTIPYATPDGSVVRASCDNANHNRPIGGFGGTADYDCAILITALSGPNVHHYYAVLTPVYGQTDIKIKAYGVFFNSLAFANVQSVIDVTGKSNGLYRRLQARANISGGSSVDPIDNAIPDMALRTAKDICKRLNVGSSDITVDGAACGLTIAPPN